LKKRRVDIYAKNVYDWQKYRPGIHAGYNLQLLFVYGDHTVISKKMTMLVQNSSAVRAMFEEGKRLSALHGKGNVYDFSLGNPNFPAPEAVNKAIIDIVSGEDPITLHGYMSNAGHSDVRQAIADSLNDKFQTGFDESNIIMSAGSAGGLNVVMKTLLDPGDEVIAISPFFLEYGAYVGNYDGTFVPVPARADSFLPDLEALRNAVSPKTKAIILNSPNNPTGVVYPSEVLAGLARLLEEKSAEHGNPIYILSDEPYRELAYDGIEVPFITKYYRNTLICYSWSKSLSLAGQRIGYIVVPREIDDYELVFNAAGVATRILGFVNAGSLMQKAVARCLGERTDINAYDRNRKLLYDGLVSCGFDPVYPQGAFYMWVKSPGPGGAGGTLEFCAAAMKYNILIVPGTAFACPGYVRIAYCVSSETIGNSMPGFKKLAEEYGLRVASG